MRIRLVPLIIAASGKVFGEHSQTHLRTNANGTCYVCRNPHHRPPTPKQIEARQRMVRAHQQYELIKADPSLLKHFEEAFARQNHYHRLRYPQRLPPADAMNGGIDEDGNAVG